MNQVAAPEPGGFPSQSEQPFEADLLQPSRGTALRPDKELKGRTDAQSNAGRPLAAIDEGAYQLALWGSNRKEEDG